MADEVKAAECVRCWRCEWDFVFGFAKNERSNVSDKELETLKRLASQLLGYDARELREALSTGKLYEVESDG